MWSSRRCPRWIGALVVASGLAACGFHLRGESHYPFQTMFLSAPPALPITI
jgi:outer membrane lipopolysaccharide assembly protein LptE/RlpB